MAPSKKHLLAASAATALITLLGVAGPSYADPASESSSSAPASSSETAADVAQQVAEKQEELTQVNEEYLDAKLELEKQNAAKADAEAKLAAAEADLATAKDQVAAMGAEQYKSGTLPASVLLLVGESPSDFIDKANAKQHVDAYNDEKILTLSDAEAATQAAKEQIDAAQAAAAQAAATISEKKAQIEAEIPKLEEKLATLTEQERAALEAAQGGDTEEAQQAAANPQAAAATEAAAQPAAASSGSASTVVSWAMSQRGKPYVWGGSGPNGYDCSGLTMMAYKQIGISLPHSSSAQRGYGTTVPFSQLQPGDLVFAPGHVAIYIGNGTVVHAPTFGSPVRTMPMGYMNFTVAKRLV
ncbi:NlpC/P60 family protein [Blastococcus sp. Marseille-P5729]|uniref:C40 family peptidase n=1 Tax=Blastococcus sp. Marseille-P5729 TaxID=2086582 RepID=UPI000D0FE358|nr:NlpC/P60 family protein [Blastococcus sp. Marseille-P5729]